MEENSSASISVTNSDTLEKNKKYTVYKIMVNIGDRHWSILRRYNEFSQLQDMLKKRGIQIKLPGKKLFGNNFGSEFLRNRRQGLNDFAQKLITEPSLLTMPEVREFLEIKPEYFQDQEEPMVQEDEEPPNEDTDGSSGDDKSIDLGPSEKKYVKPKDFEFLKVIGKGSFGKVFLARQKEEKKIYAVKVLQKKMILKRNERSHVMSERNVLVKNIQHPFLVGLRYSFQTSDKLYFVMDYVNGGELFFHLQRERHFNEPRTRFYAAEITSALGYLHSLGIIYRDLKPENILIDGTGHVKLTDFGLCKEGLLSSKDTATTFCGTPEYLAPEVLKKLPYDKMVDWWCLGAVTYEMFYGLPPFYTKDTMEMYDNILHKPLRLRTNISSTARNFLEGLLQKDKRKRLGKTTEDVMTHDFFKTIDWVGLNARNVPVPYTPNLDGELDLKNIDPEFVKEQVSASVGKSQGMSVSVVDAEFMFEGFTYTDNSVLQAALN